MIEFSSMETMIDNIKEDFHLFIKFGKKEDLEKLQSGTLHMNNLMYYNNLKSTEDEGKSDCYDGKFKLEDLELDIWQNGKLHPDMSAKCESAIISLGYEKYPVFCLCCIDKRNFKGYFTKDDIINMSISFSEDEVQKWKKNLGKYALVILDTNEFLRRIIEAFKKENIEFVHYNVIYNDKNTLSDLPLIFNHHYIAFNKDAEKFSYQQEHRFLILNRVIKKPLEISIKNLSDITRIIPTDYLMKIQIKLSQKYVKIKN